MLYKKLKQGQPLHIGGRITASAKIVNGRPVLTVDTDLPCQRKGQKFYIDGIIIWAQPRKKNVTIGVDTSKNIKIWK